MCFDFLYNFCLTHFSFWDEFSEILSKVYIGLQGKCRIFLSDNNESWKFVIDFRKTLKYKRKPRFFHSDGRTDMTKPLTVAFRNFANSPAPVMKLQICHIIYLWSGQRQAEILRYATPEIRAGHEEDVEKPPLSNRSCASTRFLTRICVYVFDTLLAASDCTRRAQIHSYSARQNKQTNKPPAGFVYSPSPIHQSREHGLCSKQYLLSGIVMKTQVVTMCNARWYLLLSLSIHM
jgi:hypothetical protein